MPQIHFEPGQIYHIYNRANGSENLFRNHENYHYFLQKYRERVSGVADTVAYCLMPNHFHLLVKIKKKEALDHFIIHKSIKNGKSAIPNNLALEERYHFIVRRTFHNFFIAYAKSFNKYHNRQGSLLQQNSKRKIIQDDAYLMNAIIYLHLNPVKHKFTTRPEEWTYTFYHDYLSYKSNFLLINQVFEWFGGREAFIQAHIDYK